MKRKIIVALGLSGGVDSAVSAYLLQKQVFDVHCVYLNCYDGDTPGCRGDQDRKDALAVAMHLGLPFRVLDFKKAYQAAVIDYFKKEYLAGRTPNPDVVCNRDIKFGLFMDWAIKEEFDAIATGHYAKILRKDKQTNGLTDKQINRQMDKQANRLTDNQIVNSSDHPIVRLSVSLGIPTDLHKDQTYFLWAVPAEKFRRVLFPLGNLLKTEVREIALKIGLPVAKKKDSTGICFVGEVRVEDFLKKLGVREKIGEVVIRTKDSKNYNGYKSYNYKVIGRHKGVWFYTMGQRHGFSTDLWSSKNKAKGKRQKAKGTDGSIDREPFYVIEKDIKKNRLIVGFGAETYRDNFEVAECNWLAPIYDLPARNASHSEAGGRFMNYESALVRIRHCGELIPCQISALTPASPRGEHQRINVSLSEAQRGVAPGQSAVFYSKEGIVLGGGIIQ